MLTAQVSPVSDLFQTVPSGFRSDSTNESAEGQKAGESTHPTIPPSVPPLPLATADWDQRPLLGAEPNTTKPAYGQENTNNTAKVSEGQKRNSKRVPKSKKSKKSKNAWT